MAPGGARPAMAEAMAQADDFRQAKGISEAAQAGMLAHEVPPTPENYAVWYAYASGLLPELQRTIDILISNKQEFTQALNAELYSRFCDTGRHFNLLNETGGRLQYAVDQVMRYIKSATGDASAFGKALDQYSSEMGGAGGDDEMRALVSGLILETQRMAERNRSLEDRLTASSGEIAELRQNLEVVRREALTDALTGIPNRKFFDTRLREAARDAMESGEPLSLLIADIDHFKQFNDTYGHQLGDQVLRLVARTLTDSVKGRDTPARYGGEEFAIILPQTRLKDAIGLADQIRRTITRRRIVRKNTRDDFGTITLSIGVSCYRPGEQLLQTVRRADDALYQAKRAGRNRVVAEAALTPADQA
jgi:diguanylate cyclase